MPTSYQYQLLLVIYMGGAFNILFVAIKAQFTMLPVVAKEVSLKKICMHKKHACYLSLFFELSLIVRLNQKNLSNYPSVEVG